MSYLLWSLVKINNNFFYKFNFQLLTLLALLQNQDYQQKILAWKCLCYHQLNTAQKMKFSIKDFFSKCDQIRRKLQIWSHLPKKSLMENFIFCAVQPFFAATEFCKCASVLNISQYNNRKVD